MTNTPLIFIANDNPDDRFFIRDAFSYMKSNVKLKIVESGQELFQQLQVVGQENLPSLIVLDYNMPKQNGAETLKILLKEDRYKKIPKIMLSTSYFQSHIENCLKMGANGYLIKPVNLFSWKNVALDMLAYVN